MSTILRTTRPSAVRRLVAAALLAGSAGLALAGAASAHVTVNPKEVTAGGFAQLTFRVPNERDNASTTKLEVTFPADQPIPFVSTRPVPGWTATVEKTKLATPVKTADGEVTEAVTKITWTGSEIKPGPYENFDVSAGPLPSAAGSMVFKAVQTYSSGEVVRWIEPTVAGQPRPEHPAPVLTLTAAASAAAAPSAAPAAAAPAAPATTKAASSSGDGLTRGLAGAGLLAGLASLGVSLTRRRTPQVVAPAPEAVRETTTV